MAIKTETYKGKVKAVSDHYVSCLVESSGLRNFDKVLFEHMPNYGMGREVSITIETGHVNSGGYMKTSVVYAEPCSWEELFSVVERYTSKKTDCDVINWLKNNYEFPESKKLSNG